MDVSSLHSVLNPSLLFIIPGECLQLWPIQALGGSLSPSETGQWWVNVQRQSTWSCGMHWASCLHFQHYWWSPSYCWVGEVCGSCSLDVLSLSCILLHTTVTHCFMKTSSCRSSLLHSTAPHARLLMVPSWPPTTAKMKVALRATQLKTSFPTRMGWNDKG